MTPYNSGTKPALLCCNMKRIYPLILTIAISAHAREHEHDDDDHPSIITRTSTTSYALVNSSVSVPLPPLNIPRTRVISACTTATLAINENFTGSIGGVFPASVHLVQNLHASLSTLTIDRSRTLDTVLNPGPFSYVPFIAGSVSGTVAGPLTLSVSSSGGYSGPGNSSLSIHFNQTVTLSTTYVYTKGHDDDDDKHGHH